MERRLLRPGAAPTSPWRYRNADEGYGVTASPNWRETDWAAQLKRIDIREGQALELRMEALNVLNHPTWFVPDQDINTTTFGRVSTANSSRKIQLSAHFQF